jgi:O-acetyl-ADP-ribose deacetylase (regulator of RNase III)
MSQASSDRAAKRVQVVLGDITRMDVDAIVNAANTKLSGGGGVDGAIHRAAGPELAEASRALAPCPTGEARITPGFRLRARWVIHAVGPFWSPGRRNAEALLASAYRTSLELAARHGVRTLAFPSISTGAYRFPLDAAAAIAVRTIGDVLAHSELPTQVTLVCFDERTLQAYERALAAELVRRPGAL